MAENASLEVRLRKLHETRNNLLEEIKQSLWIKSIKRHASI